MVGAFALAEAPTWFIADFTVTLGRLAWILGDNCVVGVAAFGTVRAEPRLRGVDPV